MSKLERIDAFDVNFVDSAARQEFKLETSSGTGEARIYVGKDEEKYDEFFDFSNVSYFFTKKEVLIKYLEDAKEEYYNHSQPYRETIEDYYETNIENTKAIVEDIIKFKFRKTYDKQKRYFLVLENGIENNKRNYSYIRNICLPRVTKYCFIKFKNIDTDEIIIYLQQIFFNRFYEDKKFSISFHDKEYDKTIEKSEKYRKKQAQYREKLLEIMPACPFTSVTDERLLIACHIKPFRVCENDEEKYDVKNGIIMTPTYHLLYDLGFITFENNGKVLISPFLSNLNRSRLKLREGMTIRIQSGSAKYLKYHRENIFCKTPELVISEDSSKYEVK